MSIQSLSWSIKQKTDTPTTKLVLILLANYADENQSCFPSEKHLAKLVGCSDRTIRRCLRYLVDNNLIKCENRVGTSNRYTIGVDTHVHTLRTPTSAYTKPKQKKINNTEKRRSKNAIAG